MNRFHASFRIQVEPQTLEAPTTTCPLAYPHLPED
jgi:hypothetical protein